MFYVIPTVPGDGICKTMENLENLELWQKCDGGVTSHLCHIFAPPQICDRYTPLSHFRSGAIHMQI